MLNDEENQPRRVVPVSGSSDYIKHNRSAEQEKRGEWLPACSDVAVWLGFLRNSPTYRRIVEQRLASARENYNRLLERGFKPDFPPPTFQEAAAAFEETESFKQLVWDFEETCLHLRYDPAKVTPEVAQAFSDYRYHARISFRAVEEGTEREREKKVELDLIRSRYHDAAARAILAAFAAEAKKTGRAEPVIATEFLARIIIRAFLVDVGEDYIPSARLSDVNRRLRNFTDPKQIAAYMASVPLSVPGEFAFSPEEAADIQRKFIEGYSQTSVFAGEVKRERYLEKPRYSSSGELLPSREDQELPPQGDQENQNIRRYISGKQPSHHS